MFNQMKHFIALMLFIAFLNLWIPADVILHLHAHEHTVHEHEEDGIAFENLHHHCAFWQFSVLPHIVPVLLIGKSFLKYKALNPCLLSLKVSVPLFCNAFTRGPPEELV
jgi:hypothetical protein